MPLLGEEGAFPWSGTKPFRNWWRDGGRSYWQGGRVGSRASTWEDHMAWKIFSWGLRVSGTIRRSSQQQRTQPIWVDWNSDGHKWNRVLLGWYWLHLVIQTPYCKKTRMALLYVIVFWAHVKVGLYEICSNQLPHISLCRIFFRPWNLEIALFESESFQSCTASLGEVDQAVKLNEERSKKWSGWFKDVASWKRCLWVRSISRGVGDVSSELEAQDDSLDFQCISRNLKETGTVII